MISFKKSKSHFLAAIGTVLIHLLLFSLLNLEFNGEQSSQQSDLDDLQIELDDFAAEDIQLTTPGKNPLTEKNDKASESLSDAKGQLKAQRISASQSAPPADPEDQIAATPDTIIPPKLEIVQIVKPDSVAITKKDSIILAEISKLQTKSTNSNYRKTDEYKNAKERFEFYQKNFRNIRNFKKVYPYALKTKEIMENLNKQLATMTNEVEKKQLIKDTEKILFKEYEAAVRTMTVSQGKLLLKLIARETQKTGYDIIKDYKGAFPASFWYGIGKLFGTDLKTEFHKEREDSLIENILTKYNNKDLY